MDAGGNSALLITTAAISCGVFIAHLTAVPVLQRLQSRRLLAAGIVYTFCLLAGLTYSNPAMGLALAMISAGTGYLIWKRPYPRIMVSVLKDEAVRD